MKNDDGLEVCPRLKIFGEGLDQEPGRTKNCELNILIASIVLLLFPGDGGGGGSGLQTLVHHVACSRRMRGMIMAALC